MRSGQRIRKRRLGIRFFEAATRRGARGYRGAIVPRTGRVSRFRAYAPAFERFRFGAIPGPPARRVLVFVGSEDEG